MAPRHCALRKNKLTNFCKQSGGEMEARPPAFKNFARAARAFPLHPARRAALNRIMLGRSQIVQPARLLRARFFATAAALVFFVAFFVAPFVAPAARAALTVAALRCENMESPLGVDTANPRLGWQLRATARGENQAAYQILVATTAELLARNQGDLWNTGRIESTSPLNIPYTGYPLATSQQIFWKVRVWSAAAPAQPSPWSAVATFTMGVLDTPRGPGWQPGAQWITDEALQKLERKALGFATREAKRDNTVKWVQLDFGSPQKIDTIRIRPIRHTLEAGYGFPLEFRVELSNTPDFKKPENNVFIRHCLRPLDSAELRKPFDMEITEVSSTARYLRLTTSKLRAPADGGKPCLALSQIEVFSGTGTEAKNIAPRATVTASDMSDDTARWSSFALVDGLDTETPDARANAPLRLRREFTVRPGLTRAIAHITGLGCYFLTVNGTDTRIRDDWRPLWTVFSKTCPYDTYDLTPKLREGTNVLCFSLYGGMYNVQLDAKKPWLPDFVTPFHPLAAFGQIRLEYEDGTAEMINTDGFWLANSDPNFNTDDTEWTRAGYDDSAWTAAVETKVPAGKLRSEIFLGLGREKIGESLLLPESAGKFECSNEQLNGACRGAGIAQAMRLRDVIEQFPSDHHRLEWLAYYRLCGPAMRYVWNLDGADLKFLNNMADSQTADGLIPNLSPEHKVLSGALRDSPECGAAFIVAAWQHYLWTGDAQPLQKYFDAMNEYADYLGARAKKYLLTQSLTMPAVSDYYGGKERLYRSASEDDDAPAPLVATAAYYEAVDTLARIASALGREDDANRLSKTASNIADAFNKAFLNMNTDARKKPAKNAPPTDAAIYANGSQISQAIALATGLVPPERRAAALDALVARLHAAGDVVATAAAGRDANVWRALAQGGRFDVILSVLAQREKARKAGDIALLVLKDDTAIAEWLYHDIAGLQADPTGSGFDKIIIKPRIVGDVTWARATHESPRGLAASAWRIESGESSEDGEGGKTGKLTLDITIPVGATATVFMPTKNPSTVMESGVFAGQAKGVRALRGGAAGNEAVFEVESGHYVFSAEF